VQDSTDLLQDERTDAPSPHAAGSAEATGPAHSTPTGPDPSAADAPRTRRPRGTGLTAHTLPELQEIAAGLAVVGTTRMRKGQLIAAIQMAQGAPAAVTAPPNGSANGNGSAAAVSAPDHRAPDSTAPDSTAPDSTANGAGSPSTEAPTAVSVTTVTPTDAEPGTAGTAAPRQPRPDRGERTERPERPERTERPERERSGGRQGQDRPERPDRPQRDRQGQQGGQAQQGGQGQPSGQAQQGGQGQPGGQDEDDDGSRRGRRGRYRDRRNRNRDRLGVPAGEPDTTVADDDVLVPVAGLVDLLDNYAFVRTSGYLAGPNDVYISLAQVRRYNLRRGDAVTGAVKQPRDGEPRRDKFNALIRLDTVNGVAPDEAKTRPEFTKLTPLYPQDRLRLETEPHILTTRVIDLIAPIGKGQRALIVSPPKAGKTMVLQAIANAITTNNPECHLMVVLVDERPEEVTDMQRSVKGEVIASTFDRHPADHITVAELSIERAKRLVELGHDVVVLLDSITRLGRAYNMAAPASGRILTGGVDSAALYPPKRFLGAARNIEDGGSLTIIATALVETGSAMDTVIFEEFKGTGNAELKLDRRLADKRIFPAIDIDPSGTRKEELLLARDELQIVIKLRRVLHAVDGGGGAGGIELLLDKLRETKSNVEFLLQVQKTMPSPD